MRINSKQSIAGQPIVDIRRLLKVSYGGYINQEHVGRILNVTPARGHEILLVLERDGYVQPSKLHPGYWDHTIKGNALAMASAANPIKRATAERQLREFLERVQAVNAPDSKFLYRVRRVALFGSMLGEAESVGDVDLTVLLAPTIADHRKFWVQLKRRAEEAFLAGRTSSDPIDKFGWPEMEVWRFLRNRCRTLSLCPYDDELLKIAPHRIIYRCSGRRKAK